MDNETILLQIEQAQLRVTNVPITRDIANELTGILNIMHRIAKKLPEDSASADAGATETRGRVEMDEKEIPRRCRLDLNTPAELAIRAAVDAVEAAGAHIWLTNAVILLGQAREEVADYVDFKAKYPPLDIVDDRQEKANEADDEE